MPTAAEMPETGWKPASHEHWQKLPKNSSERQKFVKKADKTTKRVKFALVSPIDFSQADSF
jgi:hypothetical protein